MEGLREDAPDCLLESDPRADGLRAAAELASSEPRRDAGVFSDGRRDMGAAVGEDEGVFGRWR